MKNEYDENKGRVIARGITRRPFLHDPKERRKLFFMYVFAFLVSSVFLILVIIHPTESLIKNIVAYTGLIFVIIISVISIWLYAPSKWDWIPVAYENGISYYDSPYIPYSEIHLIGYGKLPDGNRYIHVFSRNRKWQQCPIIREDEYINNYYDAVEAILRDKCRNVPWVEMEWLEWKRNPEILRRWGVK